MRKGKNEGVGLFGEDSLLRIHNGRLGGNSGTKGGGIVVIPGSWASTVVHMLGTVAGEEWIAGGGRMVMNETNEDNKGCPNGVNVSVNGNSTNKVDLFANRDGGTRVYPQLLDDLTTLSDNGSGLVVGDQDLEGDVLVPLFQFEGGVGVANLADVGKDKIHSLVNGLQISL